MGCVFFGYPFSFCWPDLRAYSRFGINLGAWNTHRLRNRYKCAVLDSPFFLYIHLCFIALNLMLFGLGWLFALHARR